ncbi:hypothetical protein R2325_16315 [Mycobacteroides chelonae]|jgi:hypothetical protein|uniref:hypothetical protein n=2 Tax=Mycobacteroides TaxID=670516 RepID=UPI00092A0F7B|nr:MULTISPECIES: hypothetical protein [Mycobacteroides]MBV6360418.1 hypothetical protein [Mycobacteroides chelonae]MEC4857139.1 hypothetical protein [Mycobacteroides chelonae]SHW93355.1 Uncharacterised protein [Mycobacteroides abscessus subsp. abscessus]SKL81393.1 Uncharacterised protein [Mycobacteroides abscessus subsp. abscessus]SKM52251.1 Uncharacterised protein [Mycobacteroides abscessus subsp. abscessus]
MSEQMTKEQINELASELVREWISTGPDADYVHDYFDGEVDALSITRIHDEACAIAKRLTHLED